MPILKCRQCGKILQYEKTSDLPWFPFCSERCKMVDLGDWFKGKHRIPRPNDPNAEPED